MSYLGYEPTPTIFPAVPFDPVADAEILRGAMKGFGTDEKALIDVLARRTGAQRLEIADQFKTLYGKDLIEDIQSETSGNLQDILVALMTPLAQLYARNIHDALSGIGTDEEALIEVFCTMNNDQIQIIRAVYETEFEANLEDDLKSDTSGTFERLMVSLCNANRDESLVKNPSEAVEDAQKLFEAGENQWGTDESTFNMILCQRNYAQLQLIFKEYEKIAGCDLEDSIKSEFSGNSEDAFLALIRAIRNKPLYFAKCLNDAIAGLGTNDKKLVRILTTRCEIDLGNIKDAYMQHYEESLTDAVAGDTSGEYEYCLLVLLGAA